MSQKSHSAGASEESRSDDLDLHPHGAEATLVRRMAAGDQRALAELYDVYAPLLVAVARRILGSRAEAEDVIHDVFLEAWRRAADYDPERGSVRAWLVLRARSRSLDRKKSAGVSRTVSAGDGRWLDTAADSGTDVSASADRETVRRVLLKLPEEQLRVLLLGYFEGLSSSEIAERTSTPIGTVKSRVAAALSRLRQELGASKGSVG